MRIGCAYFGNRIIRHAAADMKDLARRGFNFVVHTFSENDLRFYRQTVKDIVKATQDAGHEVYIDPWGVGRVFGGEAFSAFVEENSPDAVQILDDGRPSHSACPNNPAFRDFMHLWIEAAADTGAEYAFWDEPHFYLPTWSGGKTGRWGCRCDICQGLYKERYGELMPVTEQTEKVKEFKADCLQEFLSRLVAWAAEAGMKNALCVLPHEAPGEVRSKWLPFAQIPRLDVFGTDPYWVAAKKPVESVGEYAAEVKALCDEVGLEAQVWIQGFGIPKGREGEIATAIDLVAGAGVRNLTVWGVDACEHLSWIRPDDPKKTWQTVVESFQRVAALPRK